MEQYKSITDELIDLIRKSKLPLWKIAKKSGVNRRTIYNWVYCRSCPTLESALWVVKSLGYNLIIIQEKRDVQ